MEQTNQLSQDKKSRQRFYSGYSMRGTFQPGDSLTVEAVSLSRVRPGDVVVFSRQRGEEQDEIVHRVMRRISGGLVTRGDAVACEDAGMVSDGNLIGRVVRRERNGRVSRVHGGWVGLCRGRALHFYWGLRRRTVRRMQKPYAMLKSTGIIARLWKPEIFRIMINSKDGPCIQHVWKNRIVARSWPDTGAFECRKPWDLVIR